MARSLVDLWHAHCKQATIAQFSSAAALRDHINEFPAKVVKDGLAGSALQGNADVQALIADWSTRSCADVVPNAEVLRILADESRAKLVMQLTVDISAAAKAKAANGSKLMHVDLAALSDTGKLMNSLDGATARDVLKSTQCNLEAAGFRGDGDGWGRLMNRNYRAHDVMFTDKNEGKCNGKPKEWQINLSWEKA